MLRVARSLSVRHQGLQVHLTRAQPQQHVTKISPRLQALTRLRETKSASFLVEVKLGLPVHSVERPVSVLKPSATTKIPTAYKRTLVPHKCLHVAQYDDTRSHVNPPPHCDATHYLP